MQFRLPDVGEGIHEAEVVRWRVQEGEEVRENQVLVEVETDKAVVEIPSPTAGVVASIPHDPGDRVEVGETLVVLETGEDVPEDGPDSDTVVGQLADGRARETHPPRETRDGPVPAAPATRRLARELEVDLHEVEGTGPDGRVTSADVRRAAGAPGEQTPPDGAADEADRVPARGVRRSVAEVMAESQRSVPQATHMDVADVTALAASLEEGNRQRETPISWTALMVRAAARILPDHPRLNARYDEENEVLVLRRALHVGVSVDTEDGLIVPVVRDAGEKDLDELVASIRTLVERTRSRSLDLEEVRDATFTVTNIGSIGGRWGVARVPRTQSAVLVVGRMTREPAVVGGEVVPRDRLPLSVSFDHRILDGADVARFTRDLVAVLEGEDGFPFD